MIHPNTVNARVILYVNSYGPYTQEGLDCRRMRYLFEKYQALAPITIKDINSDMVEAAYGTKYG